MNTDGSVFKDPEFVMEQVDDGPDYSEFATTERNSGTDGEDPTALKEVLELAKTETKRMRQWKILVVLGILLTGAAVSSGMFFFLREQQDDDFRVPTLC